MTDRDMIMNTQFLLMAQYNAKAVIPLEDVCRDYFPHLTPNKFKLKVVRGDIKIPLMRIDGASQKSSVGIHLTDLAEFIDKRKEAAKREYDGLNS